MKSLSDRNPFTVGLVGLAVTAVLVVGAVEYDKLPFVQSGTTYEAYFAEAGGLTSGAEVQVAGYRVGQVSALKLDGSRVLVTFTVDDGIRLGDRTEAAVKTKTLLGAKTLEISPRGDGQQIGPIPLDRTVSPYDLPNALGDLTATISELDTDQLSTSLATVADTFRETPPELRAAADGVARFADTLNTRDAALRNLLTNASKVSTVLGERSKQIADLIANTNALLVELQSESAALDYILGSLAALSHQISGLAAENQNLKPTLDRLNETLAILDKRKADVQDAIPMLSRYAMSLGETVGSGPFFKAYLANLVPGQWMQPFIDAAFSDLGLDPNVLLPSERQEPQTGQSATPALPIPYPRTGQGGEPHLNLPDAITGKPGDSRYPYREPLPAPPPGGPPPGPPAQDPAAIMPAVPVPTSAEIGPPPPERRFPLGGQP
ncbi:MCE family protein [Mycobacterium sp.]|uniref:MCE family protein n=1 Tax=Mycobacterium sp. TaxID=1785 RepID=UPI002D88909C|nr:MCE family protein [Mycobacterium sp.]